MVDPTSLPPPAGPTRRIPCAGCLALVPDIAGPTHEYIGASPGCWSIYGEILARGYGEGRYDRHLQLIVDTYAVQHPGTSSRRAIQSVGAHLIGLHMALEQGAPPSRVIDTLRRATAQSDRFWWLDPPSFAGTPTILDILDVPPAEDADRITRWAGAVWHAWSPHHATVRDWAQLQRE